MAFGLFSGDKGDNIDMRMIKTTIKANLSGLNLSVCCGG